jgi:hypothetical protein
MSQQRQYITVNSDSAAATTTIQRQVVIGGSRMGGTSAIRSDKGHY